MRGSKRIEEENRLILYLLLLGSWDVVLPGRSHQVDLQEHPTSQAHSDLTRCPELVQVNQVSTLDISYAIESPSRYISRSDKIDSPVTDGCFGSYPTTNESQTFDI